MTVAIDIGNTRTKFSIHNGERLVWDGLLEENDLGNLKKAILTYQPTHGIISSVRHNAEDYVSEFAEIKWIVLSHRLKFPFINQYKTPETLGLDRLALTAAGAHFFQNTPILIVDAGTCVTYDAITKDKVYLGGAISPGLSMRLKSMNAFTEKLPLVKLTQEVSFIGQSTPECLQTGALYGLVSEIDGMIERYMHQFNQLNVVITGGDAKVLAPLIKNNIFARPKFLLEGLHVVLAYNTP